MATQQASVFNDNPLFEIVAAPDAGKSMTGGCVEPPRKQLRAIMQELRPLRARLQEINSLLAKHRAAVHDQATKLAELRKERAALAAALWSLRAERLERQTTWQATMADWRANNKGDKNGPPADPDAGRVRPDVKAHRAAMQALQQEINAKRNKLTDVQAAIKTANERQAEQHAAAHALRAERAVLQPRRAVLREQREAALAAVAEKENDGVAAAAKVAKAATPQKEEAAVPAKVAVTEMQVEEGDVVASATRAARAAACPQPGERREKGALAAALQATKGAFDEDLAVAKAPKGPMAPAFTKEAMCVVAAPPSESPRKQLLAVVEETIATHNQRLAEIRTSLSGLGQPKVKALHESWQAKRKALAAAKGEVQQALAARRAAHAEVLAVQRAIEAITAAKQGGSSDELVAEVQEALAALDLGESEVEGWVDLGGGNDSISHELLPQLHATRKAAAHDRAMAKAALDAAQPRVAIEQRELAAAEAARDEGIKKKATIKMLQQQAASCRSALAAALKKKAELSAGAIEGAGGGAVTVEGAGGGAADGAQEAVPHV